MKTDALIHEEVLRALLGDPRVEGTGLTVTVHQGVVTLNGVVSSYARRQAAEEVAHGVAGVLDVANEIEVHPPRDLLRTDEQIAHAVRHALEWDVIIPDERIQSSVAQGWVTLEGKVDSPFEASAAESAARNLAGVRGVTNEIVVTRPVLDPYDLRQRIVRALQRRAEETANRLEVRVDDRTVTVKGDVRSLGERGAVLAALRTAPDVDQVVSELLIVPEVSAYAR